MARVLRFGRRLSILYVSYPLLTVSEESAGGAEQMLLTLECQMAARGHRTTVAASDGSRVCGSVLATGERATEHDVFAERERKHTEQILWYLDEHHDEFDLIHDESGSFFRHAARCAVPVLATLHLPHSFYPDFWFRDTPANLSFNCVSRAQAHGFSGLPNLLGVIPNGIALERFSFSARKSDYLLWVGRICEEKAPHLAILAAQKSGLPLVIAGQVYPFSDHQRYFERKIEPQLRDGIRFVDSPCFEEKVGLLRDTRALLLTSTVDETSSLVAMEAMACGSPVVAARRGAFPEIVADGGTGFVVDDVDRMAQAVARVGEINPMTCRRRAEKFFSATRMASEYERLYRRLLGEVEERVAA
jgi:glycosyltransferase involved in cell wall biosynthesis